MKVRQAKKSDHKSLMSLYDIFMETNRYSRGNSDSFLKILDDPQTFVYVAENGGELVGFINFAVRDVIRYPQHIGQIEELFVSKEFRGMGVGKSLVWKVEEKAKETDCQRIYVESGYEHGPAHKFYQDLGYKKSGLYFLKKGRG